VKRLLSLISIIPVVVIQTSLTTHFSVSGYTPQLLLVIVLGWCLLKDYQEALLWAVVGGILLDLFSTASFGISALALVGVVIVVCLVMQNIVSTDKLYSHLWLGGMAALVYYVVITTLSWLFSSVNLSAASIELSKLFWLTVLVGTIFNVLLIVVVYPLMTAGYKWVMRFEHNREQRI